MFGRFVGLVAGIALLGEGYVLWRPEVVGSLGAPDLGPLAPYQKILAILAIVVGCAVMIAALLRAPGKGRAKRAEAVTPVDWGAAAAAESTANPEPPSSPLVADEPVEVDPPPPDPFPSTEAAPPGVVHEPSIDAATAVEVDHELVAPVSEPEPALVPALPAPAPIASLNGADALLAATAEGDRLRAEGRLSDAIDPYSDALTVARTRHADAPSDASARRDLANALTNVADVHDRDGRLDTALDLHEESLGLRRDLAAEAPGDTDAQRAVSLGLERLADTREARGHRSRARDLFRERLSLAEQLAGSAPGNGDLARDLDVTRERLAELDEALAI